MKGKEMREIAGETLARLMLEREDIVVLDADLSHSTKTILAQQACPERFFNMGIAEANMMGVAAGLASLGKTVFASSFAVFAAGRAFEQIRNAIAVPEANVKILATHAGLSAGQDGASHQAVEDLALMRSLPGMTVLSPADNWETEHAVRWAAASPGPVYIRLSRGIAQDLPYPEINIMKMNTLKKGKSLAILATGSMVSESLKAATLLENKGIKATVVNVRCLKPLDIEQLIQIVQTHKQIITVEEHSIIGGLYSAITEALAMRQPRACLGIGIPDRFGESGKPDELRREVGLTADQIAQQILIQSL